MILYNGATGGLGQYLGGSLSRLYLASHALSARLEDGPALERELESLVASDPVTFIHLAAMVSVPACEANPIAAHEVNVSLASSTARIVLDWASRKGIEARVIYVSSGHVYRAPAVGSRLSEDDPTSPRSVYARTKLQAEQELSTLGDARGAQLLIARVFGLIGPRQAPNYVLPALIERVARQDVRAIPGLDYVRDYLDARDVCEVLSLLASVPWSRSPEVVNVCSGAPVSIRDLLRNVVEAVDPAAADQILAAAGPGPGRPDDVRWLVGDPGRVTQLIAASPQRISLAQSVADAVASAGA